MTLLAYIDPGFGALIWQTMLAVFVGFLFYLKKTRHWIVSTFRKIFRRRQKAVTITTTETPAAKIAAKTEVR
jgi:hypothetical protein